MHRYTRWSAFPSGRIWTALFVIVSMVGPIGSCDQKQDAGGEQGVQFVDVTAQANVGFRHVHGGSGRKYFVETMGAGCGFFDYDNDGDLDLYAVNGAALPGFAGDVTPTNRLYRNNGDGTFTDVTERAGVGDTGYGKGCVAGDIDNDGDLDLYVANYGPNLLYRNNGDGTFTDVTERAGVGDSHWGAGCAFLDYDNDGDLDLYAANYLDYSLDDPRIDLIPYIVDYQGAPVTDLKTYPHPHNFNGVPDRLYRNNGDGTFTDVADAAGVANAEGKSLGVVVIDYDDDGDPDLYVANDMVGNFLYRNEGDGTFAEVGLISGVAYDENGQEEGGMGVDAGDYDNDGRMDLIVTNFQHETYTLYHNNGDGTFSDVSFASDTGRVTRPYLGWGVGFFDYDNDGYGDLFAANGHVQDNIERLDRSTSYPQRNLLFHNNGEGTFADASLKSGDGMRLVKASRGTAFGDYDNDGDVDLFVLNANERSDLLRNDGGNRNNHLTVRTVGTVSNRDGIGARVRVVSGRLRQVKEVRSGSSYLSQNDLRVHFGLGRRSTVDTLEIRWPSGVVQVLKDVPVNQFLTVTEQVNP